MRFIKAWRNRKTYEWHLDKIERLHQLPMVSPKNQFKLIDFHISALENLAAPPVSNVGGTDDPS